MNDPDEEIKKRLGNIFPDARTASKVVDIVVQGTSRPVNWSRKSNAPYYKEMYAKQLKSEIDKMLSNGNDIVYRYSTWCTIETKMTTNTLYTRINQSIRYLIDHMDTPDHYYAKWYETVRVSREKEVGVIIRFIPGIRCGNLENFKADEIQPKEQMPRWRMNLEDWLESSDPKPFVAENLALTPEEITLFKEQFSNITNVIASVTSASIKVIKT